MTKTREDAETDKAVPSLTNVLVMIVAIAGLALMLASCGSTGSSNGGAGSSTGNTVSTTPDPTTPQTYALSGSLTLTHSFVHKSTGESGVNLVYLPPCFGYGLDADIRTGAQVVAVNEAGVTVATGQLGEGTGDPQAKRTCVFAFSLAGLPKAGFYKFTIGTHTGPSYSFDQLAGQGWKVALSI